MCKIRMAVHRMQRERQDLQNPVFWRDVVVEAICSFILIFFLTSTQLVYSDFKMTPTHAGVMMGLVVFSIIEMFGHMSGAHMNPAVTLLFVCTKDITFSRAAFYMVAQVAGCASGAATVYALATYEKQALFHPLGPAEGVTLWQAVGAEVCLTFFLCTVIQGAGDKHERPGPCPLPSFPVAMMVAADIMAGATWTGAAMNPLIPLGPDVITGEFPHYWVYWVGPFIGALLSFLVYSLLSYINQKYEPSRKRRMEQGEEEDMEDMDLEDEPLLRNKLEEMSELLQGLLATTPASSRKQKEAEVNGNSYHQINSLPGSVSNLQNSKV